jgi:hypothetical protein
MNHRRLALSSSALQHPTSSLFAEKLQASAISLHEKSERRGKSRRSACATTVPESDVFMPLGLALSEKQIPQVVENIEKRK